MIDEKVYDLTQTGDEVQAILNNAEGMPTPEQLSEAFALKANASDVYTKNETYTKSEVNRLVGSPEQNYVTVDDYASLPATGRTDTIYRVANYDGENEQVDVTKYSEYAWNGTSYTLLCVKSQIGEVFDISDYNDATYANLSAALGADGANVPQSIRRGGMSIKFIQSSDNKYVQFRYMGTAVDGNPNPFLNPANWQGVDDIPTAGSEYLVKSGGTWKAVGTPIKKSVTATSTNVNAQINISLEAGTRLFLRVEISNNTVSAFLRVHHTDNTFTTLSETAKNGEEYYVILEKDADYVQLVRNSSAVSGVTYGFEMWASVYAEHKQLRKDVDSANINLVNTNYGKICFQYPVSLTMESDKSVTLTLTTVGSLVGDFGYIVRYNQNQLQIKCQSDGNGGFIKTYNVPRLYCLVADKNTGIVSVVENPGDNYLLLRPVGDGGNQEYNIECAIGPLADRLRFEYAKELKTSIVQINSDISAINDGISFNRTVQNTASNNQLEAKINKNFEEGQILKISASIDTAQTNDILLRLVKTDSSVVNIASLREIGTIEEEIVLEYDIIRVELVNYVSAVNGTVGTLTVKAGIKVELDKNAEDIDEINTAHIGNTLTKTATASGTSVNAQINVNVSAGQSIYINVTNSDKTNYLYVRAHKADGSGFVVFVNNQPFESFDILYTLEDDIDYVQAVNFISAHSGAVVNLTVWTGELNARIANNSKRLNEVEDNLDTVNERQEDTYIPTYYKQQVESKVKTIRDRILGATGISDTFVFITDVHWYSNCFKSPQLISELMKRGLADKVIMGGDVCSATTPEGKEWIQPSEIQRQLKLNGMVKDYGKIFNVRGNHDFNGSKNNIVPGQSGSDNYVWNEYVTRDLLIQNGIAVENENEPYGSYYYFDDKKSNIRYFVLYAIEGSNQFTAEQETWLINAVTNIPSGYDIVFINHDGCEKTSGLQCYTVYPDVKQIVNAIDSKSSGVTTVKNVAYDFTSLSANLLLFISGHTHHDLQTFVGGVINIGSACDAIYGNSMSASYLGSDIVTREKNTVTEQAFDHVVIDKGSGDIYCTRIGAGGDRIFRKAIHTVTANGSTSLTTVLSDGVTWGSYNNDTEWHGETYNTPLTPTNTRVSVSNGTVTGLVIGQAVVYAKDSNGNREFFNIVVE